MNDLMRRQSVVGLMSIKKPSNQMRCLKEGLIAQIPPPVKCHYTGATQGLILPMIMPRPGSTVSGIPLVVERQAIHFSNRTRFLLYEHCCEGLGLLFNYRSNVIYIVFLTIILAQTTRLS